MGVTTKVVSKTGTVIRTLSKEIVDEVTEVLGGHGTDVRLRLPKYDPAGASGQNADVALLASEIQVWRSGDSVPLAWSVPVSEEPDSGSGAVPITCLGLGWYLSKRFIDAPRTNYLTNPEFESGLTGWTTSAGCTSTVITSPRRLGAQAVRLVGAATGGDQSLYQSVAITGDPNIGTNVHLAAHYFVESFTFPALDARGLLLAAFQSGVLKDHRFVPIDNSTPVGAWQKAIIGTSSIPPIWTPPSVVYDYQAALYAPNGSIAWDAAQLVIPESVGNFDADLSTLYGQLVDHVQDAGAGYDDLSIGTSLSATGITLPVKSWPFQLHTPFESAAGELTDRTPGTDVAVVFTATARTATTFPAGRGVDRSTGGGTVTLTLGGNVANLRMSGSGAETETQVTVYGEGDGPDREEATATDTSATGGLVLGGRYSAPPGTTIDQLAPMAADKLRLRKRIVRRVTATIVRKAGDGTDYVGLLGCGDLVRLVADDGRLQAPNTVWRIMRRTWRPKFYDALEVELAEV